jgi:serine/threonine protein kinase
MTIPTQISNYEILSKLGQGASCTVYTAKDIRTNQTVAVKI